MSANDLLDFATGSVQTCSTTINVLSTLLHRAARLASCLNFIDAADSPGEQLSKHVSAIVFNHKHLPHLTHLLYLFLHVEVWRALEGVRIPRRRAGDFPMHAIWELARCLCEFYSIVFSLFNYLFPSVLFHSFMHSFIRSLCSLNYLLI